LWSVGAGGFGCLIAGRLGTAPGGGAVVAGGVSWVGVVRCGQLMAGVGAGSLSAFRLGVGLDADGGKVQAGAVGWKADSGGVCRVLDRSGSVVIGGGSPWR